ncbi:MAG: RagB/SusD family nutrient uptake outer membrane protein [Cytophagales bacterium]|nr:RagB/SusD family nutrient uptake outer membrane protein [Cytophagales bacterium]
MKNKKNLTLPVLATVLMLAGGCQDFLKKEPLDRLGLDTYYTKESDAINAINAVYSPFAGGDDFWGKALWMIGDGASDNSMPGGTDPDFIPIDNFTVDADNPRLADTWRGHYNVISRANVVLAKVPGIPMNDVLKNRILGEASFLRALAYFNMVRIFGDVPLLTDVTTSVAQLDVARTPATAIYRLIKEDLTFAGEHLPVNYDKTADVGRATKGAAKALLAKVHLTLREFPEAAARAAEVMAMPYDLVKDYGSLFTVAGENSVESVFEIQHLTCNLGMGGRAQAFFAPFGSGLTGTWDGWGTNIPTVDFVNAYETGDLRKKVTIFLPDSVYSYPALRGGVYKHDASRSVNGYNIRKYVIGPGTDVCAMDSPMNDYVIRFADVLLMFAEASNETGNTPAAEAALNRVRTRAGLAAKTGLSQAEFRDVVLHERRMELGMESERWFDLVRTGRAIPVMTAQGKTLTEQHLIFPIPRSEIDLNPRLKQNPGYN